MISREEVEKLAELARLELTEEEAVSLGNDISNILEYVGQVSTFSVDGKASDKPFVRNVMRADTPRLVEDTLAGKEEALREAFPKREGGFNVVRKIIQKDE
jgi:aspartyl-tRNA(Asn)/glutamyl-tRNA(Gln) amidotransferase subunit C